MAAARQNEIKVSITVVATKTFTAGRLELSKEVDMQRVPQQAGRGNLTKIAHGMLGEHYGRNWLGL